MNINGEHEDLIWKHRSFAQELAKISEERFYKLLEQIYPVYQNEMDKELFTDILWDFYYNVDIEKSDTFEEYLFELGY